MSFVTAPPGGSAVLTVNRAANVLITGANNSNQINYTAGTFAQTFDKSASLGNGFFCYCKNSGSGVVTLTPFGSETINGAASLALPAGATVLVTCNGTALVATYQGSVTGSQTFTTSGTFTIPVGANNLFFDLIGGGGGAGGGHGSVFKGLLGFAALLGGHAGVIGSSLVAAGFEVGGEFIDILAADAVDDAGLIFVATQHFFDLSHEAMPGEHAIGQIGAIKIAHQDFRVLEIELLDDVGRRAGEETAGLHGVLDCRQLGRGGQPGIAHRCDLFVA